ncbi:CUB domain-containing protein 1-like [Conger conger]|uniref:CUB domain-containing protein 1-like n=1 Tax=Conger conger TaxID=82655 RepID=UPI002A599B69|nr:CUB domain-containing protein 1-like [Conger conger]
MAGWFPLLVGLFLAVGLNISGGQAQSDHTDQNMRFTISRQGSMDSDCTVCVNSKKPCLMKTISVTDISSVTFDKCPHPQQVFTVEIYQKIGCDELSCSADIVHAETSHLTNLNRTFIWDLVPERPKSFQLTFTGTGMRQILPTETCPDQHTYTVMANQSTGIAAIGTFCRHGTITSILALSQSRLVLEVPGGQRLDSVRFQVSVGPEIKTLALVKVTLPSGPSATKYFSPNYPRSFPDDDLMTWEIHVPPEHNFTVQFLKYTEPQCVKKEVVVEYHKTDNMSMMFTGKSLSSPQPANRQGNFSLSLRNCEMERKSSAGLTLNFQVSVARSIKQVSCAVDLRKEERVQLLIEKKDHKSDCQMKKNSVLQDTITVASGSLDSLFFKDCLSDDLMLTINKTIDCQWKECSVVPLSVPDLRCLPTPLRKISWHLLAPEDGTVELVHRGNLQQLLPGQPCNANFRLRVDEGNTVTVGSYCPKGPIQKIQVRANVSVTATASAKDDLRRTSESFLNVSFRKDISDRYIFTVVPEKDVPVLLATPSWPDGMSDHSTISWIVTVPPDYQANLVFLHVSQPKCRNRHTIIKVQTLGSREEMFSRREDEQSEDELSIPETFYLNMSNCEPELGAFSVLSQITLEENTGPILGIALGTIAGLLLLLLLILIVVWVIRKKKRQETHKTSIYNPNGANFPPGHRMFPKSREDNESHVYASIEDTMVYGHLLKESDYPTSDSDLEIKPEVDTYRGFTGPTEAPPPPLPHSHRQKLPEPGAPEVDVYRPFIDQSESALPVQDKMVENELYGPGSNGLGSPVSPTPDSHSEQ